MVLGLSAEQIQRSALMPRSEVHCWDVYAGEEGVMLVIWKQSGKLTLLSATVQFLFSIFLINNLILGEILHTCPFRRNLEWTTILNIPDAKERN